MKKRISFSVKIFFLQAMLFLLMSRAYSFADDVSFAEYNLANDTSFSMDYIPQPESEKTMFLQRPAERVAYEPGKKPSVLDYFYSRTHPYFESGVQFDSNIYQVQFQKKDDIVGRFKAGAKFVAGIRKPTIRNAVQVMVDAGCNYYQYFYSQIDRQYPYVGVFAQFRKGKLTLKASNFFKKDMISDAYIITGDEAFSDFMFNTTRISGELKFNRFGVQVMYLRNYYNFRTPEVKPANSELNGCSLTGMYRPLSMPKTDFTVEYDFGKTMFPKTPASYNNYYYNLVWGGVRSKFTPKLTGIIKAGYQYRYFDENKNRQNFPVAVLLDYKFSKKTTLSMVIFSAGELSPNEQVGNYTTTALRLKARYQFNRKTFLDLGYYIARNRSHEPKWVDKFYGFNAQLKYKIRNWMLLSADFKYDLCNAGGSKDTGYKRMLYGFKAQVAF